MKNMTNKKYIAYNDFINDCRTQASYIKDKGFNKIVAVTRGGMVPACVLAQFSDIREVGSIALKSYEGEDNRQGVTCLNEPNMKIDERTLFVDDLYDSGNTYRYLKQKYPTAKVMVIYSKDDTVELDFPAVLQKRGEWLVFPWEFDKLS